jgi:hypothetical protein
MAFVSFVRAMQKPAFLEAAKATGLRAESQIARRCHQEAQNTAHTWAKYPPGAGADAAAAPRVDGNIKIDVATAVTAGLALS